MITLALSKGRIFDETLPLLKAAGIEVAEEIRKVDDVLPILIVFLFTQRYFLRGFDGAVK